MMNLSELNPGDIVYALHEIANDGSIPDLPEDHLLVQAGCRGVIINTGHLEETPEQEVYLVRFEDEQGNLGPELGCWPEELSAMPLS
jgi:nitrogen fixation protein NifZ